MAKITQTLRYFIRFSYFGQAYHGWQRQPNARTVQQLTEEAFGTLLRHPVSLVGAGRTDTGVHARDMAAHADLDENLDSEDLIYRINALLPGDIAIKAILPVKENAHARFDAVERTYEYWVVQQKDPFYADTAHYVNLPLDLPAMNSAAAIITEFKDFKCFSKTKTDVKTFDCVIRRADWKEMEDRLVFTISADRFLRNMVRAVVGTLLDVGLGKITAEDVKGIIKSRDRGRAGVSVPAKGLYLTRVLYPEHLFVK